MSLSKSETNRVAIPAGRLLLKKAVSKNSGRRSARLVRVRASHFQRSFGLGILGSRFVDRSSVACGLAFLDDFLDFRPAALALSFVF